MDPLLESPALRVAGAALATAVSVSALAHVTRLWGKGAWATTSALLLGADDATKGDLRFAAVCAALGSGLSWVLAFDARLRELPPTGRAVALIAGLPSMALIVSALADMLAANEPAEAVPVPVAADADLRVKAAGMARQAGFTAGQSEAIGTAVRAGELALGAAATVATNPTVRACAGAVSGAALEAGKTAFAAATAAATSALRKKKTPVELSALIEHASAEVAAARARSEDESTREALGSMEEALTSYAQVVAEPDADLERIERAVRELVALARRCHEEEGSDAFRALGLRRDASFEDVKRVYRDLARIYHADAYVAGVDPEKFVELTAAYERVRAYYGDSGAEPRNRVAEEDQ